MDIQSHCYARSKASHFDLIGQLLPLSEQIVNDINDTFVEIEWVLEEAPQEDYDYTYDQIVSIGELFVFQDSGPLSQTS
ncbi:MAG: hypothetical protein IPO92_13250 [Saprospiraceae bacterium]|nr:hypothetical protein [Saprospiraceae bacterium]